MSRYFMDSLASNIWLSPDEGGAPPDPNAPPPDPAKPATPAVDTMAGAKETFLQKALQQASDKEKLTKDKDISKDSKDDKTGETDADKDKLAKNDLNADKGGESGDKTPLLDVGGDDFTPEDHQLIQQTLADEEAKDLLIAQVDAWSGSLTDSTKAWLNDKTSKIELRKAAQLGDAKTPEGKKGDPLDPAAVTAISLPESFLTVRSPSAGGKPSESMVTSEFLRQHGIDPSSVHQQYAPAITALLAKVNEGIKNQNFLYREAKKSFESRDSVKTELFQTNFEHQLKSQGFVVDDTVKELIPQAKKVAFVKGEAQPWPFVIQTMTTKYPAAFRKSEADPGVNNPVLGKPNVPVPPVSPQGTRNQTTNVGAQPSNKLKAAKTIEEGGSRFSAALAQKLKQSS